MLCLSVQKFHFKIFELWVPCTATIACTMAHAHVMVLECSFINPVEHTSDGIAGEHTTVCLKEPAAWVLDPAAQSCWRHVGEWKAADSAALTGAAQFWDHH
jgi:hypothetical protein